jgi:hypothetical protein
VTLRPISLPAFAGGGRNLQGIVGASFNVVLFLLFLLQNALKGRAKKERNVRNHLTADAREAYSILADF